MTQAERWQRWRDCGGHYCDECEEDSPTHSRWLHDRTLCDTHYADWAEQQIELLELMVAGHLADLNLLGAAGHIVIETNGKRRVLDLKPESKEGPCASTS
jgi:hypothetical protein